MGDYWKEREKALEDSYFVKKNQEALERIQKQRENAARPSPINGEPMEQITIMGVVVDRCKESGGLWLDKGELEQLMQAGRENEEIRGLNLLTEFFHTIAGK